jgi:1-acyl-sn-glycerol-3-phosphate acyltransferase
MNGSPARAVARLAGIAAATALHVPPQLCAMRLTPGRAWRIPRSFHRCCLRAMGITVNVEGAISPARPTLFVANHVSYLDIPVLGSLTELSFVAKDEIAGWPVAGAMARMQRTIFIGRRRQDARGERDLIEQRLAAGDRLVLFPEGTTGNGTRLRPFKSALLSVVERVAAKDGAPALAVQPVTIAYTRLDGMPLTLNFRHLVAWYGAMAMGAHLWRLLGLGRIEARVVFHPVVGRAALASRKALARHCEQAVGGALARANAGRATLIAESP